MGHISLFAEAWIFQSLGQPRVGSTIKSKPVLSAATKTAVTCAPQSVKALTTQMNTWIAAFALMLCCAGAAAQTTVDIPIDDARVIATRALRVGQDELAIQIARRLLQANPDDRVALLVVAAVAPRQGNAAEGRRAGARAWTLSQSDLQRYEAARLTALAAANEKRFSLSEFWLRRALTVSPSETETERTSRDAAVVRRLNPWSTRLNLSVVPSNNVNGGADDDILTAPGQPDGSLSADAQAVGGIRATGSLRTQYRLFQTSEVRFSAALQYQLSRVRVNEDGRDEGISGSEFATDAAEISLIYEQALDWGGVGAQLTFGDFDFGGDNYYDFRRTSISWSGALNDTTALQLAANHELQSYESTGIRSVQRNSLLTSMSHRLTNGDRISGTLGYTWSEGYSVNNTYDDWNLRGSYSWADPFGPVSVSINGGLRRTDYPDYNLPFGAVDGGREDLAVTYGLDLGLADFNYYGFSPGLSISGSIADSNVSRFTRNTLSAGFTLRSIF